MQLKSLIRNRGPIRVVMQPESSGWGHAGALYNLLQLHLFVTKETKEKQCPVFISSRSHICSSRLSVFGLV